MGTTPEEKQVLIADPSDTSRQALSAYLRGKGLEIIEAADGSKALAEALLRKPDILLLDLTIPILPPDRLVQILRSNPNTRPMRIFFLSDREESVPGFRQGMDEFIHKPFHEEEILLRIRRALYQDPLSEALTGDSEITGNLSQIFLPDLWQMLAMNRKSGILQVEAGQISGSVYIERGEILSAVTRNIAGEKALFRLIPLKEGKFRFLPGKVGVRRTIFTPSQRAILEGLRQDDELRQRRETLPNPNDAVAVIQETPEVDAAGGVIREILLLAEFCATVEEIVDNCGFPDLVVHEALIGLRDRGVLQFGNFNVRPCKSELVPSGDLDRLRERLEEKGSGEGSGQIVFYLPNPSLLYGLLMALGKFRGFEADNVFFSLRRKEGIPSGMFGRLRLGENGSVRLYAFPYLRVLSPLWYTLAPSPMGIVVFLEDGMPGALESLMTISDYTRGVSARVVLAVMGRSFPDFGLGENTLRLFRNRLERLGCILKVRAMQQITAEEIRDSLATVIRHFLDGEGP